MHAPPPGVHPGYQNLSGYLVPHGAGIPQYQHMQGAAPALANHTMPGYVPHKGPPALPNIVMQIARPTGTPVSKALPHGQMSATTGLAPRGAAPRRPPLRSTAGHPQESVPRSQRTAGPSDTVMRDEDEYINWLATNS